MKQVLLYGSILCLCLSCSSSKYIVKVTAFLDGVDLSRTLCVYIPITDEVLSSSSIIDSTYSLLQERSYRRLEKYLNRVQERTSAYYLSKTFYLIAKKQYRESYSTLMLVNDDTYNLLKELLSVDLSYENSFANGVASYEHALRGYQQLIDKYPDNGQLKKIVSLRIKYARYGY